MLIDSIEAVPLRIPFRETFAHAAAARSVTQTLWVTARAGVATGSGEGCPRCYVTGEDLASALAFVARHRREWRESIVDVTTLSAWVQTHRAEIDANPAAWSAVELALLDLIGRTEGRSVESLLGMPEIAGSFRYSAVLGDADAEAFARRLGEYLHAGFSDFKIKLSGDIDRDRARVGALVAA
jgi:L-alanine-DL-glutamate epimerase-like enolase superfamily enzyme